MTTAPGVTAGLDRPASIRAVVKDVFIYGAGDVLLRATAFITLPVYTRILSPTDYGAWSTAISMVSLLGGLLVLGGDSAYARFYFEANSGRLSDAEVGPQLAHGRDH